MAPRKRKQSRPAIYIPKHRPIPVNAELANSHPMLHSAAWKMASNYIGDDLTGRSTVVTNGHDDISRANWQVTTKRLADLKGIEIHRFNSWANGKIEAMMVRHDAPPATLDACEALLQSMTDYPCLDDGVLSAVQFEIAVECWDDWGRDELRTAIRDARDGDVAKHVLSNWSDVDLDRLFKASCRDAGVSWYEPIDGDSAQFPINTVAASIASTLASGYAAETAVMIERELADYHRDQLCLPGFDGCMPDVELIGPQVEAWREHALYC